MFDFMKKSMPTARRFSGRTIAALFLMTLLVGCGSESSTSTEFERTLQIAKTGAAEAQSNLGVMYVNGTGVPQDDVEAVKWYRKSAEQGFAMAQLKLGAMYENGRGVPQDHVGAVKWYRMAAEQGDAEAQSNLGLMYVNGTGVPQDHVEAYAWWSVAAAGGYADAAKNRDIVKESLSGVSLHRVSDGLRSCLKGTAANRASQASC